MAANTSTATAESGIAYISRFKMCAPLRPYSLQRFLLFDCLSDHAPPGPAPLCKVPRDAPILESNNTAPFREPDQLILRSQTLNMYLNLQRKWPVLRYLGATSGSLSYILWPRQGIGNAYGINFRGLSPLTFSGLSSLAPRAARMAPSEQRGVG